MKILIPPSEGKTKIKSKGLLFSKTNFGLERHVNQVVRLLELIDDEDLRSVYGTSSDLNPILELSARYELKIIEDAAQAFGVYYCNHNMCNDCPTDLSCENNIHTGIL